MKLDWCNKGVAMPYKGSEHLLQLLEWLENNIDERDWDWDVTSANEGYDRIYYFAHERDAVQFALRWA